MLVGGVGITFFDCKHADKYITILQVAVWWDNVNIFLLFFKQLITCDSIDGSRSCETNKQAKSSGTNYKHWISVPSNSIGFQNFVSTWYPLLQRLSSMWVSIWAISRFTPEAPVDGWHSWTVTRLRNESVYPAALACSILTWKPPCNDVRVRADIYAQEERSEFYLDL